MRALLITIAVVAAVALSSVLARAPERWPPQKNVASLEERVDVLERHVQVKGIVMAYRGGGGWIGRLEAVFPLLRLPFAEPVTSTLAFSYLSAPGVPVELVPSFRIYGDPQQLSAVLIVPEVLRVGPGERLLLQITSEGDPIGLMEMDLPGEFTRVMALRSLTTLP